MLDKMLLLISLMTPHSFLSVEILYSSGPQPLDNLGRKNKIVNILYLIILRYLFKLAHPPVLHSLT